MKNIVKLAIGIATAAALYKAGEMAGVMNGVKSFMKRSEDDIENNRMTVETSGVRFTVEKPTDKKPDVVIE